MATQHTYGWADLDAANRTHYGRGKPDELLQTEQELLRYEQEYDQAVDEYYDRHYCEPEYYQAMLCAKQAADDAERRYNETYIRVYGRTNKVEYGKNEDF